MGNNQQAFIIPFLAKIHQPLRPYAYPFLRIFIGLIFLGHGYVKLKGVFAGEGLVDVSKMILAAHLPAPLFFAWATLITEFVGGICVVLGLFTRMWAFFMMIMMYLIVFFFDGFTTAFFTNNQIQFDLTLAVIVTVIAVRGAGAYSLDSNMKKTF